MLARMRRAERERLSLDNSRIQQAIVRIEPDEYFEALADRPGAVFLRAKEPVCQWQGLHIAASADWSGSLADTLCRLAMEGGTEVLQISRPSGRGWYDLYTSRVNFGCWVWLSVSVDSSLPSAVAWARFTPKFLHLRLSSEAVAIVVGELLRCAEGGIRSQIQLRREVRPYARPQALWFWRWPHSANNARVERPQPCK
jgi:hypothetical protein